MYIILGKACKIYMLIWIETSPVKNEQKTDMSYAVTTQISDGCQSVYIISKNDSPHMDMITPGDTYYKLILYSLIYK